jgi:uncharacterized protein (DUF1501 family)
MLPIFPDNAGGRLFGLHPSMVRSQQLFNDGKMAFISKVGTLVEPTTKEQYWQGQVNLPLGLYSHSDQGQQWMSWITKRPKWYRMGRKNCRHHQGYE